MRVAAFDLGTNTTLCAVVERGAGGEPVVIGDRAIVTGLGRGARPALDPARVAVTLEAVRELGSWARSLGATRLGAVGTSALRDAPDRETVLAPVRAILGGPADAISGQREAALTFAGARVGIPAGVCPLELSVVDVGGGSTEIVRGRADVLLGSVSLDVGAVRLTERWLRSDPPLPQERADLEADVDRALLGAPDGVLAPPLLLLAGSATNLAALALELPVSRLAEVVGRRIASADLFRAVERLVSLPIAERASLPGIERGREATLAGGGLLLARIVARTGASEVLVGDGGVRFGLARELLGGS